MLQEESSFALPDGMRFSLHRTSGEVLQESSATVTRLHQTADTVLPQSGNKGALVIPGRVYSTVEQRQSIWLRERDGSEKQYDIRPVAPLGVRQGHAVSLIFISAGGPNETPHLAAAVNHCSSEAKTVDGVALFRGAMPNPMTRYHASKTLWAFMLFAAAAGAYGYVNGTGANETLQRTDVTARFARCEEPQIWWTKTQRDERKACMARAGSPTFQRQIAESYRRAEAATKTVEQAQWTITGAIGSAVLVLCLMGIRRARFASNVRVAFVAKYQDAIGHALAKPSPSPLRAEFVTT